MLIYGDAFWPTYTTGDNTGLIATDSMKNFIQRETLNFPGYDLEDYCRFLAAQVPGHLSAGGGHSGLGHRDSVRGAGDGNAAFAPAGPERATARIELRRAAVVVEIVEARSGIHGFRLLRLGGSAFHGFVRDQYTTLPDIHNRPLHMWLDLEWTVHRHRRRIQRRRRHRAASARLVHEVFQAFESGSIQQVIYQIGNQMLAEHPAIAEVHLEAEQSHLGYGRRNRAMSSASTPMRARPTAVSA